MDIRYKLNAKILLLAFLGAVMMCCSYLMFVYDPLQLIIKRILTLSPGTLFFSLWTAPPYKVYINVYIFSVTNYENFTMGVEKLKLEEIGPYCYQEILTHHNATDNGNGTITYIPRRDVLFVRERSVGDPYVDRIVTPNIPLVGISAALQDASMFTNLGLTVVSNTANAKSFNNLSVHEYLWGYDDLLVRLANEALPAWINFEKFGILDRVMALDNASNIVTLTTDPTIKHPVNPLYNEQEVNRQFYVQEFNGSPGLKYWGYQETEGNETAETNSRCNFIGGTYDGTLFPQNMAENNDLRLYRRAFCRPVPAVFEESVVTKDGFNGMKYRVRHDFLATPEENPENACYCTKKKCLPSGLASIAPCYYDIPIALSQPHFLNAEPFLLEQIEGMKPNKSKHDISFTLHKELGFPIEANLRIQINLDVGTTRYNSRTKIFNGLYIPLCWLELQVDEVPTLVHVMSKLFYVILPVAQEIFKFLFAILGAACISCSALWMLYTSRINENKSPLDNLPFSRFSLRRSSEYKPIPVMPDFFRPDIRISK